MTTLFAGGLDDITKLMQDARDIGIGLDDKSLTQIAEADDALQKMYASIGAMVDQVAVGLAPAFTEVSTQVTGLIGPVTKLFAAFNSLGDAKWKFAGELMVASFDVGMETIKLHWADMLNSMLDQVAKIDWKQLLNPFASVKISDLRPDAKPENLNQAQGRLDELIGKLADAQQVNEAAGNEPPKNQFQIDIDNAQKAFDDAVNKSQEFWINDPAMRAASAALDKAVKDHGRGSAIWMDADKEHSRQIQIGLGLDAQKKEAGKTLEDAKAAPAKAEAQSKFTSGISSMFDKLKDSPLMGTIDSLKMGAEGMVDRAKIQVGALGGTLSNMFADRKKEVAPRLSGAMAGGSVDAYSTIVQAMMTRGKDPVVAATEKQTKDLIKGLKPKREFKNIDSFVSLGP
jgi:hypothetical protein